MDYLVKYAAYHAGGYGIRPYGLFRYIPESYFFLMGTKGNKISPVLAVIISLYTA